MADIKSSEKSTKVGKKKVIPAKTKQLAAKMKKEEAKIEVAPAIIPVVQHAPLKVIEAGSIAVAIAMPGTVATVQQPPTAAKPQIPQNPLFKLKDSDPYLIQVSYDKAQRQFTATCVEFSELKAVGPTREKAVQNIEDKIEDHINYILSHGDTPTEPLQSRVFPERLDIPISQHLYRKLDLISRQEKVAIDRLVAELLTSAVDRRYEGSRSRPVQQPQQNNSFQGNQQRHGQNQNQHQHQGHRGGNRDRAHGGQQNQSQGRFRDMDNRDNFMEYVRNLEKGSNWKKR